MKQLMALNILKKEMQMICKELIRFYIMSNQRDFDQLFADTITDQNEEDARRTYNYLEIDAPNFFSSTLLTYLIDSALVKSI